MVLTMVEGIEYEEISASQVNDIYNSKKGTITLFTKGNDIADFHRKIITDEIEFINATPSAINMHFYDCIFMWPVHFIEIVYEGKFSFRECKFKKDIIFSNSNLQHDIEFVDGRIDGQLVVNGGSFKRFSLCLDCNLIGINAGKFDLIWVSSFPDGDKFKIERLLIHFREVKATKVIIEDIRIDNLHFYKGFGADTEMFLKDIIFIHISFIDFFNTGKLRLFNMIPVPNIYRITFWIQDSNMGKAEFFNIDLRRVNTLFIKASFLIDCTFVNVSWPETLKISDQITGTENLLDEKEMYRQLKSSYSKQGDAVLEHQFHGLEMNAYIEYLSESRKESVKKYWLSRKLIKRERTIILQLSALTSNYGQSFWRPLITLGTVTAILFTCMVWAEGVRSLKFIPDFSGRQILATIAKALAFANPLRKYETELERWPLIIDIVIRIIASYCIFNIIRATRRFVK